MVSESYLVKDKCFEDGDEFAVFKTLSYCSIQERGRCGPELQSFLKNPADGFSKVNPVLKDSRTTFAGLIRLDGKDFFLKKYNNKGFRHSLRYLFRMPRPLKAFRNSWLFSRCGIPVPETFAASCEWKNGLLKSGLLICEFYNDSIPTLDFHKLLHSDTSLKNEFAAVVADYMARMHGNGLAHGDLKMSNIFVRKKNTGSFSFGFWDLDAARIKNSSVSEKKRIEELARVVSSFIEIASRLGVKAGLPESIALFADTYCAKSGIELSRGILAKKAEEFFNGK